MTTDASGAAYLTQACRDHRLQRERNHLPWIDDAQRGLGDIAASRTLEADDAIAKIQHRRALAAKELTNK